SRGGLFKADAPGWAQFAHPLLRQVVYDEIPPPVRAGWHAAAFRLLVAGGADPAEAAEHAARAGVIGDPEAVAVLAQAGRLAMRSDKSEAVRALLDEAFISWPTGGPALATPLLERARELAVDGSPRLRLRTDTAWAFSTFLSGDPTGIAVIESAVRDALANPEADTTDFAWSWGALGTYGNMAKWTERFTEAARAYEIGMQAAERMRLPVAIAAVAVMHGDTCIRIGKLQEALQIADRATLLSDLAPERAFWAAIIHAYTLAEM